MKAAHVGSKTARMFLRTRKDVKKCDQQKLHQELHERFLQAYTELRARGERITIKRIADLAHLKQATAGKYLHALRKGGAAKQQQAETRQ